MGAERNESWWEEYEWNYTKDNRIAAIDERLREYCRIRNPEALAEAEKALKKYPNSFEIVHAGLTLSLLFPRFKEAFRISYT